MGGDVQAELCEGVCEIRFGSLQMGRGCDGVAFADQSLEMYEETILISRVRQ
jgi:hypothetical protein